MKRSDLIVCISFAFICWISRSEGILKFLCELRNDELISVFNLYQDIIIQINNSREKRVEFWRISNIIPEIPTVRKNEISKEGQAYLFNAGFIQNDPQTTTPFDEERRIFGYYVPVIKHMDWPGIQELSTEAILEFEAIINTTDRHFVCLHGFRKKSFKVEIKPYVYIQSKRSTNEPLIPIRDQQLEEFMTDRCIPNEIRDYYQFVNETEDLLPEALTNGTNHRILSFINWPKFGFSYELFHNITVIQFNETSGKLSDQVKLLGLVDYNKTAIFTWSETEPRTSYYHGFKYNSFYKYFFCGEGCTLDTKLNWMTFNKIDDVDSEFGLLHSPSNITIAKLVRCDKEGPDPDPSSFCRNNGGIQSIFNLGKDLYIQTSSRFWRYPYNRFTNESNPLLGPTTQLSASGMRLEPTFGSTLSLDVFDTNYPIYGFTYTLHRSDWCKKEDKNCNEIHRESRVIWGACLYGKQFTVGKKDTDNYASYQYYSYFYTPYGLTKFTDTELAKDSLVFCGQMQGYFADKFESAATYTDSSDSNAFDQIFLLYTDGDKKIIKHSSWPRKRNAFPTGDEIVTTSVLYDKESLLTRSIFIFKNRLYYYDLDNIIGLPRPSKVSEQTFDRKETLSYSFFNCPFNTIGPLVPMKVEAVCDNNPRHFTQSVFNIGNKHYHQIGPYFYTNVHYLKYFKYDEWVSGILNDYFDTTHRLTAFPIEINDNFEVIFYGKSSFNFESLGEFIFALFKYNPNTNYLEPIKRVNTSQMNVNLTVGLLVESLYRKHGFIDAMGNLRTENDKNLVVWVREDFVNHQFFDLLQDKNPKDMLLPTKQEWDFQRVRHDQVKFESVFGIFLDWDSSGNNKLVLVAHPIGQKELTLYYMNKGSDDIQPMTDLSEKISYHKAFCEGYQYLLPEKSESAIAPKIMSKILAVLLIILLILSVAFGSFLNQNKKNIHSVGDPKVNTVGQPGHSSERQPSKTDTKATDKKMVRSERI